MANATALARKLGVSPVDDLLVMHRNSDPFFKGSPSHWRDARWFAELWKRFEYANGVHLRRVHYQILSTGQRAATGEPYSNALECWSELCAAGAAARILGLVDPEAFVDRRNDPPRLHVVPRELPAEPEWGSGG